MVTQERRRESKFNGVAMLILTTVIGFTAWAGDNWYKSMDKKFDSIDQKQDKIFQIMELLNQKENKDVLCMTQNIARCCKESTMC